MFFDDLSQIKELATKNGTSIFVVPSEADIELPQALVLKPEDKSTITIEQVRQVRLKLGLKQTNDQFVLIRPAERLGLEAANALLKNLEEPGEKIHYVLVTNSLSRLLPTILSRAAVYFLRDSGLNLAITADEETKELAKKLLVAKPAELVELADKITKKKKDVRERALGVLGVAIEMLYKTYFLTGKEVFVQKLPKFLLAYESIMRNGHVKLHLVADLC